MARYRLSETEIQGLRDIVGHTAGCPMSNGMGSPGHDVLDLISLMLETADSVEITFTGPEEELCGNCAKPLDGDAYSSYACSELCEEAILERKHQEDAADERLYAEQGANLATSTASEERGVYRHTPTGEIYVVRVAHGGEDNGDVTVLTGSIGPYRSSVSVDDLLARLGGFQTFNDSPAHLEWLEDEANNFERLDLVS